MTVHQWLYSDQNYQAGVALYEKLGSSAVWKSIFAKSDTDYNRQRLLELLTEIASQLESAGKKSTPAKIVEQKSATIQPGSIDSDSIDSAPIDSDSIIEQLKAEWIPLYKEMSHLHAQLTHLDPKKRSTVAFRILDLEQQINKIWKKQDYVREYGKLPAPITAESLVQIEKTTHDLSTPVGIKDRILNLRVSLSKHKNNPKRKTDLQKWVSEKADLEAKLKALENDKKQY